MGETNFTVTFEENRGSILENIIKDTLNEYFRQHPTESITDEQLGAILGEYLINHPIEGVSAEEVNNAIADYMQNHPIEGVTAEEINTAVESYLQNNPIASGEDGKSAFQIAQDNGFSGTESEWLASLKGAKGDTGTDGKSAYEIAVDNGFSGTESEWLESLQGESTLVNFENELTSVDGIEKDYTYTEVTYDETFPNQYMQYTGSLSNDTGAKVVSSNVNSGEKYAITSGAGSYAINYAILDSNGNILDKFPNVNAPYSGSSKIYRKIITIPENGAVLKASSIGVSEVKIESITGSVKVNTVTQDTANLLGTLENIDGIDKGDGATFITVEPEIFTNYFFKKSTSNGGGHICDVSRNSGGKMAQINVNGGEVYKVHGSCQYLTGLYAVYDANGARLAQYPPSNDTVQTRREEDLVITMPENAKYLRVGAYPTNSAVSIAKQISDKTFYIPNGENISFGNVLFEKKWCVCGDSFTIGDFTGVTDVNGKSGTESPILYDAESGHYKTYPYWIGKRNKMTLQWLAQGGDDFTNCAEATSPFSDAQTSPFNYTQIDSDCDYVTLMYGLNESNLTDAQIGAKGDTTNATLWGAYYVVISAILTANPLCKIGIIIPDSWITKKYHDAVLDIARYYGIPCLDLKDGENVPIGIDGGFDTNSAIKQLRNSAFKISESNGHPTLEAHKYRSTIIENFLRTL